MPFKIKCTNFVTTECLQTAAAATLNGTTLPLPFCAYSGPSSLGAPFNAVPVNFAGFGNTWIAVSPLNNPAGAPANDQDTILQTACTSTATYTLGNNLANGGGNGTQFISQIDPGLYDISISSTITGFAEGDVYIQLALGQHLLNTVGPVVFAPGSLPASLEHPLIPGQPAISTIVNNGTAASPIALSANTRGALRVTAPITDVGLIFRTLFGKDNAGADLGFSEISITITQLEDV